jgi:hypothetical protein
MRLYNYETREFPFAEIVASHLGKPDLALIHQCVSYALFTRDRDQSTVFHEKFYAIGEEFFSVYRPFIRELVRPIVGEDLIYQRIPTFRVHLPNNVAVGEFHRDRDYFHDPAEINFWLPLTRAWDTNTIWIESEEGKEDFMPYHLEYGHFLKFSGANLKHGNKVNKTGFTRVSFDFRVIPLSQYVPNNRRSINRKMRFTIGDYFEKL